MTLLLFMFVDVQEGMGASASAFSEGDGLQYVYALLVPLLPRRWDCKLYLSPLGFSFNIRRDLL